MASLETGTDPVVRCGQAIFNTNLEDDNCYELEVEVEECMALAESTVTVYLDGTEVGTIYVNEYGNGKETFCVETISTADAVTVVGAVTLTSGEWRLWNQGRGKK